MTKRLLITGAGVDRTKGIDFPLANTLLPEITAYLKGDGKEVEKALRVAIPNLRFSFEKLISQAVADIATKEPQELRQMVKRVEEAVNQEGLEERSMKLGELIIKLFNKLVSISEDSQLDQETEDLIIDVFGKEAENMMDSDSILDIHRLALSDTFKFVLKATIREGLSGKSNPIATVLTSELLNIENLLVGKFLGFYNNKAADIKSYIYISWVLWAYLVYCQQRVHSQFSGKPLPFYGEIPSDLRGLTLNYTTFLDEVIGSQNTLHFHGGLKNYVRMDTRDLLPVDDLSSLDPAQFIRRQVAPNLEFSDDEHEQKHVIPAFVPPLRLKPILSRQYIELWARADRWVSEAEHIVVAGYSFNSADEHFNDILRNNYSKRYDIIDPNADNDYFQQRIEKVFQRPVGQFTQVSVLKKTAFQSGNIRLIPAYASDVDIGKLF